MTARAGQAYAVHGLFGARVLPRRARGIQHRAALGKADRKRLLARDDGVRNEAVAVEIGGLAEIVDLVENQPWNRRLLQRHKPFVGEAECSRALIGVIEPAQLFLSDALIEPDGFL